MTRSYLLLPLLLTACQKEQPEFSLSPATQTGANTLSCLVDGQVFLAYGRRCSNFGSTCEEALSVRYQPTQGRLLLETIFSTEGHDEALSLVADSVFAPGLAGTQHPSSYRPAGLGYSDRRSKLNYSTADPKYTHITITRLDTTAHIISGTFEGDLKTLLINPTTEKLAVVVTEGRFDVKYGN